MALPHLEYPTADKPGMVAAFSGSRLTGRTTQFAATAPLSWK